MALVYSACNLALRGVLRAFADWRVYGRENIPSGAFIIVANHQSNMDPPLVGASLGRHAWFLSKAPLFRNPLFAAFLRSYGAFPMKRDGRDLEASLWALKKLRAGDPLVLFPEGSRNPGRMKKALPGVALLAMRARVPILPVGITGTERLGPMWRVAFPTGRITVTFGEPFALPAMEGKMERSHLESLTQQVMRRVAALLPVEYRGIYGEEEDARSTSPASG